MKKLDPKAIYLFFFNFLLRSLVPLVPIIVYLSVIAGPLSRIQRTNQQTNIFSYGYGSVFGFMDWLWLIIPLYIVFCYVWAELSYKFYRYELLENGFRKESGVIYKNYTTIPYDRIQNVDINRGILARILNLSDLQIQTAGFSAVVPRQGLMGMGMVSEGRLPGLSKEVAEQLRDELILRSRQSKNQGL